MDLCTLVGMYTMGKACRPFLLDLVKNNTGGDSATARTIGVKKQQVSDWRHMRQKIPAKHVFGLCEMSNQVPGVWLTMIARASDIEVEDERQMNLGI